MVDSNDKKKKKPAAPAKGRRKTTPSGKGTKKSTKPKQPAKPKEQQLGDTPVAPWEMPTAEEKQEAKPVRKALSEAIAKVDTPKKAEEVVKNLEAATSGETAQQVEESQTPKPSTAEAAKQVEKAGKGKRGEKKAEKVLEETARVTSGGDKRQREAVAEAAQEVLNPEQQGTGPEVENEEEREYLRQAVLKRLKPADALDAALFLRINHLTHTHLLNAAFYGLTLAFSGGTAWYAVLLARALRRRHEVTELARDVALPLMLAGLTVELPIKSYFKRKRPFITIIQAIVIGKKPGTWSFPSGHSATAFAGAWLLNRKFPLWSPVTYALAGLVAFSRIYLGDHYPGDVLSGSLAGTLLAMVFRKVVGRRRKTGDR